MANQSRSSTASRVVSLAFSLAAVLVTILLAGAGKAETMVFSFGGFLVGSFSWAAFFIPLWLAAAAVVCFLPGFRPAAIFMLIGSVLPFLVLALFARLTADPALLQASPVLEALGLPSLGFMAVLFALFLGLVLVRLAFRFFPLAEIDDEDGFLGDRPASPSESRPFAGDFSRGEAPRRLLSAALTREFAERRAGSAVPEESPRPEREPGADDIDGGQNPFEFSVPELPPAPKLRSLDGLEATLSSGGKPGMGAPLPPASSDYIDEDLILAQARDAAIDLVAKISSEIDAEMAAGNAAGSAAGSAAGNAAGSATGSADGSTVPGPAAAGSPIPSSEAPMSEEAPPVVELPIPLFFGTRGARHTIEFTSVPPGQGGSLAVGTVAGAAVAASLASVDDEAAGIAAGEALRAENAKAEAVRRVLARKAPKAYSVPVEGLLNVYPDGQYWIIDDKTRKSAEVLQETLAEFNIKAEVTGIRKGPVITMFEILPAPGVRLSKIANLSDNIALRLAASSVRIVAPIPGKHAVGIEVPNERRSIVSLKEIVENEAFRATRMEIPVVLGKDIAGEAQFIDLVQTPHLLIAGATGSGKSVCVNSIILSILFRRSPEEVRMILIDPKIVELKLYNDVPHLLTPVITEPKRAFQALQYCICEMERRYSMLDRLGVRDIKSYNRKIKDKALVQEKLPYIVVVIDEFADLMATTGKELESTLARLAAMSRAVGIHLVLATQRPSIDVITGLIKANIPSRIAFMVASKFDSRIIIDMVGAEKLLGRGDMLFASAWDPFPIRMQGAFVSEEEVEKSVEFVKTLGAPNYIDEEIFIDEDEEDEGPTLFDDADGDPLFEQALEIVLQQGKASASYIQRKLKVGYNRAARLVELMEERGIVGPSQGSKPRDLVRNPDMHNKINTPPANRLATDRLQATEGPQATLRLPSLLADLETVPGQRVTGQDEED